MKKTGNLYRNGAIGLWIRHSLVVFYTFPNCLCSFPGIFKDFQVVFYHWQVIFHGLVIHGLWMISGLPFWHFFQAISLLYNCGNVCLSVCVSVHDQFLTKINFQLFQDVFMVLGGKKIIKKNFEFFFLKIFVFGRGIGTFRFF